MARTCATLRLLQYQWHTTLIRKPHSSTFEAKLAAHTVAIASAYVRDNASSAADLHRLIARIHSALAELKVRPRARADLKIQQPTPGQIKRSILPNGLISFIDGKPYMMLKRHLRLHGLDPDSYRSRYGLPADYPVVAPSYSQRRSEIARSFSLPHRRRKWLTKADV